MPCESPPPRRSSEITTRCTTSSSHSSGRSSPEFRSPRATSPYPIQDIPTNATAVSSASSVSCNEMAGANDRSLLDSRRRASLPSTSSTALSQSLSCESSPSGTVMDPRCLAGTTSGSSHRASQDRIRIPRLRRPSPRRLSPLEGWCTVLIQR